MKRLLIAYDGSPGAEMAIRELRRGGLPESAEAKVLMVADVWVPPHKVEGEALPPEPPGVAEIRARVEEVLQETRRTAAAGADLLRKVRPEWKVTDAVRADSPGWGILTEANEWRADLIVIGSHGKTPLERFFLGSVSYKVAAEASCSVRVVRERKGADDKPERILIGLDGSGDSASAVEEVLQRQWRPGTHVELVTVTDAKLKSRLLAKAQSPQAVAGLDGLEDALQAILRENRSRITAQGLTVQSHVFEGDPKTILLRHAAEWEVDCIFLGARGMEHGRRLYLGTVASAVCSRAHCTVEIVRRRSDNSGTPSH